MNPEQTTPHVNKDARPSWKNWLVGTAQKTLLIDSYTINGTDIIHILTHSSNPRLRRATFIAPLKITTRIGHNSPIRVFISGALTPALARRFGVRAQIGQDFVGITEFSLLASSSDRFAGDGSIGRVSPVSPVLPRPWPVEVCKPRSKRTQHFGKVAAPRSSRIVIDSFSCLVRTWMINTARTVWRYHWACGPSGR